MPCKKFRSLLLLVLCLGMMAMPPALAQLRLSSTGLQLIQQAQQRYISTRYQEAVPLLQEAVAQFAAQGDVLNQAMALGNLAATYGQLGDWNAANQAVATSLSLLNGQPPTSDQQQLLAQTLDIHAQLQFEQGQTQDALTQWTQAVALYTTLGNADRQLQSQIHQSQSLQALGLYPRACKTLLSALQRPAEICKLTPETIAALEQQYPNLQTLRGMNALGHVLRVLGQLDASQQILSLALQVAQQQGFPQETAAILLHLGNTVRAFASQPNLAVADRQQMTQVALKTYEQASQVAIDRETWLQAQLNQFSLLLEQSNTAQATSLWQHLKAEVNPFPKGRVGLTMQINLAQSLINLVINSDATPQLKQHNLFIQDTDQLLQQAMPQSQQLGDPRLQSALLSTQGRLEEVQQQWQQAEALTAKAIVLAPPFQAPDLAYQLFWQMARLRTAQGDSAGAVNYYTQAVKVLSSLRGDLITVNPEVQFSFRESVEPIYRNLVGLLLQDSAASQANLNQARQVIESLQLAELDNFFQDACADVKPQLIDQLDPAAAVFYPIILADRLEVILAIPDHPLSHYSTHKPRAELEATFKQLRTSLRPTSFPTERLPLAQKLYDWLIRPAESALTESHIQTLVFVPDGYLQNLPLSTLHNGHKYLIEQYSIALTPGLQLLEPRFLRQLQLRVLTGALTEARQGFVALPAVANEVKQIAAALPTSILLDQQFTEQALQEQVKTSPFPIIHLATHGQFSSNAADTFLLTWDRRISVRELGELLRGRTEGNQAPIELLVLSACQTATGDDRAALGLAGLAIRSGARSTLATLWNVNDESTSLLMAEFYRELIKPGTNKSSALRNAQLKLLHNPSYQHPYFWAPFVLVGNWL